MSFTDDRLRFERLIGSTSISVVSLRAVRREVDDEGGKSVQFVYDGGRITTWPLEQLDLLTSRVREVNPAVEVEI